MADDDINPFKTEIKSPSKELPLSQSPSTPFQSEFKFMEEPSKGRATWTDKQRETLREAERLGVVTKNRHMSDIRKEISVAQKLEAELSAFGEYVMQSKVQRESGDSGGRGVSLQSTEVLMPSTGFSHVPRSFSSPTPLSSDALGPVRLQVNQAGTLMYRNVNCGPASPTP